MNKVLQNEAVKTHASQLWKFIICGVIGFACDATSLTLFVEFFHIDPRIAVILSSFVGAVFVFFANKFFTFRNREKSYGNQVMKFLIVYGLSIAMNALLSNLLLWIGVQYFIAKMVAVGIGAVWNYMLSHGFIFKKKEQVDVAIV
jgi:putative flippase GtrA